MAFKKYKNIKNIAISSALIVSGFTGPSAFADTTVSPIPVGFDKRPQFELSLIDLTNNKLDFGVTQPGLPGFLENFGAWIVDDSDVEDIADLEENSLTRVFWNDDGEVTGYRKYIKNTTNHYVVPSEVKLAEKSTGKIFYMANFDDGTVWAYLIDYSDCLSGWTTGKACAADTFEKDSDWYVTSINYVLVDVDIEETEDDSNGEDNSDDSDDSSGENDNPDNSGSDSNEGEDSDNNSDKENNSDETDDNNSENTDSSNEDNESSQDDNANDSSEDTDSTDDTKNTNTEDSSVKTVVGTVTKIVEVVKTIEKSSNSNTLTTTSTDTSNNSSDTSDVINDTSEIEEGSGNTTLDVPNLGGENNKVGETVDNLSWILVFLSGMLAGTTGTWFLLSSNRKTDRKRR